MKFDCGPTWAEKVDAWTRWHPWFAWYPVRIPDTRVCVWWETIERRTDYCMGYRFHQYRLPEPQEVTR